MIGRNAAITAANSAYAHSPITGLAFSAMTRLYPETIARPSRGMSRARHGPAGCDLRRVGFLDPPTTSWLLAGGGVRRDTGLVSHGRWALLIATLSCAPPDAERCVDRELLPGGSAECVVPGWTDRGYSLRLPDEWDGVTPTPAIVMLHGAGGSRQGTDRGTCPGGDESASRCLARRATDAGYVVIIPDGTGQRPTRRLRSWNSGGGDNGLACLSPIPCTLEIDDLAYVDELLAEVRLVAPLDPRRVFAVGLSNGSAMSHRLACERSDVFAAIVGVGGQNQHGEGGGACAGGTPVLDIHGTEDPIWPYDGGLSDFVPEHGVYASVAQTMEGWRVRNGCDGAFDETAIPDTDPDDKTTSVRRTWQGCTATTEHIEVRGGGHTWPGGYQYLSEDTVGRVARDFGSEVIMEFFEAHARP